MPCMSLVSVHATKYEGVQAVGNAESSIRLFASKNSVFCKLVFITVLERALSAVISIIDENPPGKLAKYFYS